MPSDHGDMFTWRPGVLSESEPKPEPTDEEATRLLDEYQRRVAWRTLNLMDIGFSLEQVLRINPAKREFDWHDAERLIQRGCSHATAVRLLEE